MNAFSDSSMFNIQIRPDIKSVEAGQGKKNLVIWLCSKNVSQSGEKKIKKLKRFFKKGESL
jgi:hypothetical protein